jgi:hypothetical protein
MRCQLESNRVPFAVGQVPNLSSVSNFPAAPAKIVLDIRHVARYGTG